MSDKENLREETCPSKSQEIEIDESIQLSRENPEVLSDIASERMDEKRRCNMQLKAHSRCFCFLPDNGEHSNGQYFGARLLS